MKTEIMNVTPSQAGELLKKNTSNRKMSDKVVKKYIKEMKEGKWKFTGDPIRISKDNILLDGQHRLTAIKESGITVQCLLMTGLDSDIFDVLDTGKSRNASDVLSINNIKYPTVSSSIARFILAYNSGLYTTQQMVNSTSASNADILKFVNQNGEALADATEYSVSKCQKFKLISHSIFGGLFFIFNALHEKTAFEFFEQFSTGLNLEAKSPILHLREKLIRDSANKSKLPAKEKVALVIKAWNLFRKEKSVQRLVSSPNLLRAI